MPIPLIVICAVIALLILLCLLRIRVTLALGDEVSLQVRLLCLRLRLYPRKAVNWKNYSQKKAARIAAKKAKKAKKQAKKAAKKKIDTVGAQTEKPQKTTLPEKLRLVRALCAALFRRTQKHLRLHAARLHITVATGDAAKTAVLYGAVCQALVYLLALLDRITRLKAAEPEVAVNADFVGEHSSADVKLVFSIPVWAAFVTLVSVMLAYIKAKHDRKLRRKQKEKKAAAKAAREQAAQKG